MEWMNAVGFGILIATVFLGGYVCGFSEKARDDEYK
jgi:hypothetical protein